MQSCLRAQRLLENIFWEFDDSLKVWLKILNHGPFLLGNTRPLVNAPSIPNSDTHTSHQLFLIIESSRMLSHVYSIIFASPLTFV